MRLDYYDNVISYDKRNKIYDIICSYEFNNQEYDRVDTPPVGTTYNIEEGELHEIMMEAINGLNIGKLDLFRAYINKFKPNERPFWHNDDQGITVLYYANLEWSPDELGETQFYLADTGTTKGILPIPGRIAVFDGLINHRATSFRTQDRYTIAYKFA
jgi:hypothetical protein